MEALTVQFLLVVLAGAALGAAIHAGAIRYARKAAPDEAVTAGTASAIAASFAGGAVAAFAAALTNDALLAFTLGFGWLLLALAVVDLRSFLLPDRLNLAVAALGAVMVWQLKADSWMLHAAGGIIGYGLLWGIETAYRHLRGREGLGRGDAKLLGAIGLWVGAAGLPPVLLVASLAGIIAALAASVRTGAPLSGSAAIAFGPWIALGGYVVWLAQAGGWLWA